MVWSVIDPSLDPLIANTLILAQQLLHLRLEETILLGEVDRRHFKLAEFFDLLVRRL